MVGEARGCHGAATNRAPRLQIGSGRPARRGAYARGSGRAPSSLSSSRRRRAAAPPRRSAAVSARRCGRRPSSTPTTRTCAHSSPFAAWIVDERHRRPAPPPLRMPGPRGRGTRPASGESAVALVGAGGADQLPQPLEPLRASRPPSQAAGDTGSHQDGGHGARHAGPARLRCAVRERGPSRARVSACPRVARRSPPPTGTPRAGRPRRRSRSRRRARPRRGRSRAAATSARDERDAVARVDDERQVRERVADLGALEEAERAEHAVRDALRRASASSTRPRLVARPVEDGDLAGPCAADRSAARHQPAAACASAYSFACASTRTGGPARLAAAAPSAAARGCGRSAATRPRTIGAARAVVAPEHEPPRVGEVALEAGDVRGRRPSGSRRSPGRRRRSPSRCGAAGEQLEPRGTGPGSCPGTRRPARRRSGARSARPAAGRSSSRTASGDQVVEVERVRLARGAARTRDQTRQPAPGIALAHALAASQSRALASAIALGRRRGSSPWPARPRARPRSACCARARRRSRSRWLRPTSGA